PRRPVGVAPQRSVRRGGRTPPRSLEEIRVPQTHPHPDVDRVLLDEQQIRDRLAEIGAQITADYADEPPVLVGVLRGAVMVMADLARQIDLKVEMDWMAVSSYGSRTTRSGERRAGEP